MKVLDIYQLALKLGMDNDLRGAARVRKNLAQLKAKYEKLSAKEKVDFDTDKLVNCKNCQRCLQFSRVKVSRKSF